MGTIPASEHILIDNNSKLLLYIGSASLTRMAGIMPSRIRCVTFTLSKNKKALCKPPHMYLFKTSAKTLNSVIANQKHAFKCLPKNWEPGEIILVSKNRSDCRLGEKQIQYIMFLQQIRPSNDEEFEKYWPGNRGRWRYMADCTNTTKLKKSFNIEELLGPDSFAEYGPVVTFKKVQPLEEEIIKRHLKMMDAIE